MVDVTSEDYIAGRCYGYKVGLSTAARVAKAASLKLSDSNPVAEEGVPEEKTLVILKAINQILSSHP